MSLSPDPYQRIADVIGSHHGPEARRDQLSLYVAIGDSFTAGTGSPPGEAWPDRLASALRLRNPSLAFRNLAVEGATSAEVHRPARRGDRARARPRDPGLRRQ